MNDKAGLAANQDYGKDELAAGKLLTKHTALQTAVNSYNPIIQALAEQATKLIHSGHFAAAKIATRQVESLARDKNSETIKGLGTILSDFVANSYGEYGTHLVENHQSLSITNEPQFKKTRSPKLKYFGHYGVRNQTVNLETKLFITAY